jgi:hypothetical protein
MYCAIHIACKRGNFIRTRYCHVAYVIEVLPYVRQSCVSPLGQAIRGQVCGAVV